MGKKPLVWHYPRLFYRYNTLHINTLTHVFQISRFKSAYFSTRQFLLNQSPIFEPELFRVLRATVYA